MGPSCSCPGKYRLSCHLKEMGTEEPATCAQYARHVETAGPSPRGRSKRTCSKNSKDGGVAAVGGVGPWREDGGSLCGRRAGVGCGTMRPLESCKQEWTGSGHCLVWRKPAGREARQSGEAVCEAPGSVSPSCMPQPSLPFPGLHFPFEE